MDYKVPIMFLSFSQLCVYLLLVFWKVNTRIDLTDLPFIHVLDFDPREIIATYNDYIYTHVSMLTNRYVNEWCDHTENIIISIKYIFQVKIHNAFWKIQLAIFNIFTYSLDKYLLRNFSVRGLDKGQSMGVFMMTI